MRNEWDTEGTRKARVEYLLAINEHSFLTLKNHHREHAANNTNVS